MLAWILDRAKERSTWMGLFSLAGIEEGLGKTLKKFGESERA